MPSKIRIKCIFWSYTGINLFALLFMNLLICPSPCVISNAKSHKKLSSFFQARDDFYKCVADAGVVYSLDAPIPAACAQQRQAYENSCRSSWVRHFDTSQDKELRILKTLRNNINASASTAAGGLQGTDHREQ